MAACEVDHMVSLRQIPAFTAALVLGLGLAQVGDSGHVPTPMQPALRGSLHKLAARTPSLSSASPSSNISKSPHAAHRQRASRHETQGWHIAQSALPGADDISPYVFAPFAYWPGRWYPAPGFGDNRSWPSYADGVCCLSRRRYPFGSSARFVRKRLGFDHRERFGVRAPATTPTPDFTEQPLAR